MAGNIIELRDKRRNRTRVKVKARNRGERKRIYFRVSNKYLYAQLIDDASGKTLVTVSSLDAVMRQQGKSVKSKSDAVKLAELFASKVERNVDEKFVFDRGEKLYHGKVKAFAEALREVGFNF